MERRQQRDLGDRVSGDERPERDRTLRGRAVGDETAPTERAGGNHRADRQLRRRRHRGARAQQRAEQRSERPRVHDFVPSIGPKITSPVRKFTVACATTIFVVPSVIVAVWSRSSKWAPPL